MNDTTGYGLHGDFLNGWTDQCRLESAMQTCTQDGGDGNAACTLRVNGQLGQGSADLKLDTPAPVENVGLNGPIARLPNQ